LQDLQLGRMDSAQILALLRHLPGVFNKLTEGALKEGGVAQLQAHLAAAAPGGPDGPPPPLNETDDPYMDDGQDGEFDPNVQDSPNSTTPNRRRRPDSGTDEWIRLRKDNHKEVERRRRGNINEGINELSRIVPNGSNDKAKGAILSRAVQYIHQLKENEARNIEKWTLEKLLMDQAMGDLQAQLEEMRKMWEEERSNREALEAQLATLKSDAEAAKTVDESEEGPKKRPRVE